MSNRTLAVLGLILLLGARAGSAEDWPTYRHDAKRTALSGEKLSLPLELKWVFKARHAALAPKPEDSPPYAKYPDLMEHTLPVIAAGDSVFFNSAFDGRTVCLDAATGKVRWQFHGGGGMNRTPTFHDGKLYVGSDDGNMYILDASSGSVIRAFNAAPGERQFLSYGRMISVWPVRTDVTIRDGAAYFASGIFPHEGAFIHALDLSTGKLIWRNGAQSENAWRDSVAPAGHILVTENNVFIPKDFRGYGAMLYGAPIPFRRHDGHFVNGWGFQPDAEFPNYNGGFWPLMGVQVDKVRHFGFIAWESDEKSVTAKELWRHDIEGRWTDVASAVGVRHKRSEVHNYDPDLCSVVYAGGTVYHIAMDTDPAKAVGAGVYARDPADGKLLWSAEIAERANQLVVANGRLIVGTRGGTIYCYGPAGAAGGPVAGAIVEPIEQDVYGSDDSGASAAADAILAAGGVKAGYAVVLDCDSGRLAYELAKRSELYVCAVFDDAAKAAAAREKYTRANLHLNRIATWVRPEGVTELPYSSFVADLVVSESGALPAETAEIDRVTKPIRGVALFTAEDKAAVGAWAKRREAAGWALVEHGGKAFAKRKAPALQDAGGWTHKYASPGRSNCSQDGVLKPPIGVVWYGKPIMKHPTSHPALVFNGVLVVHEPDALTACDQYTGRQIWRTKLDGIDTMAGGGGNVFAYVKGKLVHLDLETGQVKAQYGPPFAPDAGWGWMAVSEDGKAIYGESGGRLFAIETESGQGKAIWAWNEGQHARIGGVIMTDGIIVGQRGEVTDAHKQQSIADMRAYFAAHDKELGAEFETQLDQRDHRVLVGVNAKDGSIAFERGIDAANVGGRWTKPVVAAGKKGWVPTIHGDMIAHNGVVILCTSGGADKGWGVWPGGGYQFRALAAHDAKTGKLLWYRYGNYRTRPVIVDNVVHAEPWGFDLRTGKKLQREHPITGESADWAWCRADKHCGMFSASKHFLFGRSMAMGYQDLLTDQGLYTFWHSRNSCKSDSVSGGGIMIKPPQAMGCMCAWSLPFTVAMGQVTTPMPATSQSFAQPGEFLPVKHLYFDVGGTGDRRDHEGKLWLQHARGVGHPLLLGFPVKVETYDGGAPLRGSAIDTAIDNTDLDFVYATCLLGIKSINFPLVKPEHGKHSFEVTLGFAAPAGDAPGQRVFDVTIDGKRVLERFDIVAEAGAAQRAITKSFTVESSGEITIAFAPAAGQTPTPAQMPLVNAISVIRK